MPDSYRDASSQSLTRLWQLGVRGLTQLYEARQASPVEALESVLSRIAEVDASVGAFSCVLEADARAEARDRTEELTWGIWRGPLHGVPVAVKELFDVKGAPGDYGSDVLSGRVADTDAELVRRLRRGGAVIVGTTRSHEFGWGITTRHARRGGTCNPWDLDFVAGGSSGGSGAAVASGMVPVAVGSDTGGSIRIPACFCGVAGLKPTFGRVSRTGGLALAPSFDTPGALGRTLADTATMVDVMSGGDGVDNACPAASQPEAIRAETSVRTSLSGIRVGISTNLLSDGLDAAIAPRYEAAVDALANLGAEVTEVGLPDAESTLAAFVPIQMAEAYDEHHRAMGLFPDRVSDYGSDVASRLWAASEVSIGEYLNAQRKRQQIVALFERQLLSVDAILSPVSGVGPSRVDNPEQSTWNSQPRPLREAVLRFTVPQNMTGLPTSVIPAGFDSRGLPTAVQLVTGRWRESTALDIGTALQMAIGLPAAAFPELGPKKI